MTFISATRLKLSSFIYLPSFFITNEAAVKQLIKTPGFISGKELTDKGLTFWTLTAWQSAEDMKAFRNGEPHRKAMQKISDWCNEAAYVHWSQEEASLPAWPEVHARMQAEGKLTRLRKPSRQQLDFFIPAPKWVKMERPLKPAVNPSRS